MDWLDLLAVQGTPLHHHSSKTSTLWHSAFFAVQLSHSYMTTWKTIDLTRWTFVTKVMSLLFNMLSRLVITFLLRSKRLLISWLSLSWWWTGRPGVLQFMGSQRVGNDWATELNWAELILLTKVSSKNLFDSVHQFRHCSTILSASVCQKSSYRKYPKTPGGSDDKASVCNARDLGLIPGLGRSPGEGNGSPL